jgi:murein DD-endopeptidase MepM/ murein hydrolase activator NlpD
MLPVLALLLAAVPFTLTTSPRHVYVENDARDGKGPTETFVFRLVVRSSKTAAPEPTAATLTLRSGANSVKTLHYSKEALAAIRSKPSSHSVDADAAYVLRFAFDEPVAPRIDRVTVRLETGRSASTLEVPIADYAQKTKLLFPLKGDFLVVTGHVSAPAGHEERSQQFAYDIVGLGPHLELLTGPGTSNTDFVSFGWPVMAPAAGTVTYARNDVDENGAGGNQDVAKLLALPDPPWGVGGNCVVIDHGNGEWSFLAHLQKGSVLVKAGDRVAQGTPVGKLGNSGATTGPHLHYHLMDGPKILVSDGLPARFENTCKPIPKPGVYCDAR